jgi:hypothetical protein
MFSEKYFRYFIYTILLLTSFRLLIAPTFNLVPQEAYYWLYIQRPALGYFDHPPICSYTIGIFTGLFGDNEFAVRFGMIIYSIGTALFLFLLAKKIFKNNLLAYRTIIFLNLTVFFNIHSIVATPDAPLLFFWSGAMFFFYKALFEKGIYPDWIIAGIFAGFAVYSKYTGALLFVSLFLTLIFLKKWNLLFSPKPYISILVAMLVFSPVIYWNFENNWASFLFQSTHRAQAISGLKLNYFFQLIASQLYELTPLFFILGIIVGVQFIKQFMTTEGSQRFLFFFSFPIICFFFVVSLSSLVKMNWILPAYLSMFILITDYLSRKTPKQLRIVKLLGFPTSAILIIVNLSIITFPIVPIEKGDTWTGWKELAERITILKSKHNTTNRTFIFSNDYKIPAELSFYTQFKDEILSANVYGKPALQFDFWFNPNDFEGWDALFIFSDYEKFGEFAQLSKYFTKVEFLEEFKIIRRGITFRTFYIYLCHNYQGKIKEF